jgi:hypothetical protein
MNLEQVYRGKIESKYGLTKLELSDSPNQITTLDQKKTTPSKHAVSRIQELKDKFKMQGGLQVEGLTKQTKQTVEEYVTTNERTKMAGHKLCTAKIAYAGEEVRLYYTIKK